jgi:hypothetical protein
MKKCRAASTQDTKAGHYINILLSSVEYETFVKLMKIMRPVAEQRAGVPKKADAKDIGASPARMSKDSADAGSSADAKAEGKSSEGDAGPADAKSASAPVDDKGSSK